MSTQAELIADNVRLLATGQGLVEALDPELYAKPEPALASSGIGSHVRHVLDHYASFLAGVRDGQVDYDRRERDPEVEAATSAASTAIQKAIDGLNRLRETTGTRELEVRIDTRADDPHGERVSRSTIDRELQFLLSHTVHHFALIAVILRLNGHTPPDGFGVAPSTLRFWNESGACAR